MDREPGRRPKDHDADQRQDVYKRQGQRLVEYDLIQTVEEFGAEAAAQKLRHTISRRLADLPVFPDARQNEVGAEIGGQNDDCLLYTSHHQSQ